jgi:hypothetical protein
METLKALDAIRIQHATVPAAGSADEIAAVENFRHFFSSFAADRIEKLLPKTYAQDTYFNDTLKTIQGIVEACTVEVLDVTRNEHGEHLVRWKMMIRFKRFKKGQDTWTVGMSHLRFNAQGLVQYHQDYWNATDGIFRHIPVLGYMIEKIIARL